MQNKLYKVISLVMLVLTSATAFAQNRVVDGKIIGETGVPVVGAAVIEKGTANGSVTDVEGNFSISAPAGATLVVECLGYVGKEVTVTPSGSITIVLTEDNEMLEETVVVGYGTQKKVSLTGAVSAIKGDNLLNKATGDITNSLAGQIPGLMVMQRIGQPGSDAADLNIRGFGAPLVIVDGVEQAFGNIDPNEIESISVLKDASASVYGSRAGNGVILVNTKRGNIGKPQVSFSYKAGFSSPTRTIDYANAGLWAELTNEAAEADGLAPVYSQDIIAKYYDGTDPRYPNTNWKDATVKKASSSHDFNINLRGGNERVKYFISGGYLYQDGLLTSGDIDFNRVSFRSNVDAKVTDVISVYADFSGRLEKRHEPGRDMNMILKSIQAARPNVPVWYEDKTKVTRPGYDSGWGNPVALSNSDYSGYNDDDFSTIRATAGIKLDFGKYVEGLSAEGKFDYRLNNDFRKKFQTPFDYWEYNYDTKEYSNTGAFNSGKITLNESWEKNTLWYALAKVNYDRTFGGKHHVRALALWEAQSTGMDTFSAYREGFMSTAIEQLYAGGDDNKNNNGSASEGGRMSFVGNVGYDYMGKYLFDAVLRYDGSPKFSPKHRWGFFPSVSAGWRISEEPFIKDNAGFIDNLKLRLSYGQAGVEGSANFNYLSGYEIDARYIFASDESVSRGIKSTGIANPDAVWATTSTANVGVDFSMYDKKLYFEADAFYRVMDNILATRANSLPSTFGASLPEENLNKKDTRGFELTIGHSNKVGDFLYDISGYVSWARSKWLHYDEPEYADEESAYRYRQTGNWTNLTYGYKTAGLFASQEEIDSWADITNGAKNNVIMPGDIKYLDLNDDKVINWKDQRIIGKGTDPEIFFGLNTRFSWKNLDLSLMFQGATNYSVYYSEQFISPFGTNMNPYALWEGRWQSSSPNPSASLPRIHNGTTHPNTYDSDFWIIENAYYLRLKNVQLSYSLPKKWSDALSVSGLKIYLAGTNLFTLTNVRYRDPESTAAAGWQYPVMKTVTLGLNVNF